MRTAIQGFTLLEVLLVVALSSVLASVAWPSFQQHIVRGKRHAAQVQMLEIAARQQQFLLAQQRYADRSELETAGFHLPDAVAQEYRYELLLGTGAWPSFVLSFIPQTNSSQQADGTLLLYSDGRREPEGRW